MYMSIETSYKEEGGCIIEDAPLAVGAGAVHLDGGKAKRLGFFVEVLSSR